jgi:hypothetical protein
MSESINPILEALTRCTADEQRQVLAWLRTRYPVHSLEDTFGTTAEVILEAIARASDLSRRGVLGLIAEASFKVNVIDSLPNWQDDPPVGDEPFDFRIRSGERCVRIQVKRQRLVAGKPMRYKGSSLYVAETQRSRKGVNTQTGEDTRPYRFGEFDILAVSMQPVTGDWSSFRFTPQRWLIPRRENPRLLQVLQPVSLEANSDWSGDLSTCIEWLLRGEERRVRETL